MSNSFKEYCNPGKKNFFLIYLSYMFGIIIPILPIVGAYFAYTNMSSKDEFLRSHYIFAFRTFCMGVLGNIIAMFTTIIHIGSLVYFFILTFVIIRSVIALQLLLEDTRHPNPLTFWIK